MIEDSCQQSGSMLLRCFIIVSFSVALLSKGSSLFGPY